MWAEEKNMEHYLENCLHCGKCTEACVLLREYNLDLPALARQPALWYNCMLCGYCAAVCPRGIDGAAVIGEKRRGRRNNGRSSWRHWPLLWEKKRYLFANYSKEPCKSLLFVGCNFLSFFPESTGQLLVLARRHKLGTAYDCCGKPIYDLGRKEDAARIIREIHSRLDRLGVNELVTVCPNCHYYLRENLALPVVSIYQKLKEWGMAAPEPAPAGSLFLPCPDRSDRLLLAQIADLLSIRNLAVIKGVQCCGLGGGAAACGAKAGRQLGEKVKEQAQGTPLYTYCASCAGQLRRQGCLDVRHLLPAMLDLQEQPDVAHSLSNRRRSRGQKI